MGFPDDFVFKGSKTEVAKQIGNAVPPDLAGAIAHMVKAALESPPTIKTPRPKRKREGSIAETVTA